MKNPIPKPSVLPNRNTKNLFDNDSDSDESVTAQLKKR